MQTKAQAKGLAPLPNHDSGKSKPKKEYFRLMRADSIVKKTLDWLWFRYLPKGTITLLTGDPSAGKSTLILDIVARLSNGIPLPGEEEAGITQKKPVRSWILSSEDQADTIILWRLENQKANMENVFVTDQRVAITGPGLKHFEAAIIQEQIGFVIIDTVTTWMGGEIDMNKANEVMNWMNPLKEIADRTGCTIVLVRHRRKGAANDNKLYSGMGSIGFTAAVRSELSATVTKSGMRLLSRTKGNIGAEPPTLCYTIVSPADESNVHGILSWSGTFEGNPDDGGVTVSKKPKKVAQAQEWLRSFLRDGPKPASECFEGGRLAGFPEATMKRAKSGMVDTYNSGQGWIWKLSPEAATTLGWDGPDKMECE